MAIKDLAMFQGMSLAEAVGEMIVVGLALLFPALLCLIMLYSFFAR